MILLKNLIARNFANQYKDSNSSERVQLPVTICALDKYTAYEVQMAEDRKSLSIYSEATPTFFNDNHILSKTDMAEK